MEDYLKACPFWMFLLGLQLLLWAIPNKHRWGELRLLASSPSWASSWHLPSQPWDGGQLGSLSSTPLRMELFSRYSLWVRFGKNILVGMLQWDGNEWQARVGRKGRKSMGYPWCRLQTVRGVGVQDLWGTETYYDKVTIRTDIELRSTGRNKEQVTKVQTK